MANLREQVPRRGVVKHKSTGVRSRGGGRGEARVTVLTALGGVVRGGEVDGGLGASPVRPQSWVPPTGDPGAMRSRGRLWNEGGQDWCFWSRLVLVSSEFSLPHAPAPHT